MDKSQHHSKPRWSPKRCQENSDLTDHDNEARSSSLIHLQPMQKESERQLLDTREKAARDQRNLKIQ